MYSIYRQCGAVGWGVGEMLNCAVDHFLREFYTLILTRFRTYKIASPPQTKMTSEDDIKGLVSLKFLRPCSGWKVPLTNWQYELCVLYLGCVQRRESTNRLAMATFWRLHSIVMVNSAQPSEGGGCTLSPFLSIYYHGQVVCVRSSGTATKRSITQCLCHKT